jgi:hypothetical protein
MYLIRYKLFSTGVKLPEREADNSSPPTIVKKVKQSHNTPMEEQGGEDV